MKKEVAIVGSGFAAWGAAIRLSQSSSLKVQVLDIGLTQAEHELAARPVANAKPCHGSFFCYGINDPAPDLSFQSKRMCSSHAFGGFSTVYSGAILYPRRGDLRNWPRDSQPDAEDYEAVLAELPLLHHTDELETEFPAIPDEAALSGTELQTEHSVIGMSRLAVRTDLPEQKETQPLLPFSVREKFEELTAKGAIHYSGACYVRQARSSNGRVELSYLQNGVERTETFDAVFLGAGCVNSTTITDRSLYSSGTRKYSIYAPGSAIHAFLRFPGRMPPSSLIRIRNGLPEIFLEVLSPDTHNAWSHTQLSTINQQIIDAICSRMPSLFHPLIRLFRTTLYFALSGKISGTTEAAVLHSTIDEQGQQSVVIHEPPVRRYPELVRAVRRGIRRHWRKLRMVPVPFGEQLADFFRGNRLGGWHFGGSLPMRENPSEKHECTPAGELNGLPCVYILDSAAFPSLPSSTVALLTAANGHRVARNWLNQNSVSE